MSRDGLFNDVLNLGPNDRHGDVALVATRLSVTLSVAVALFLVVGRWGPFGSSAILQPRIWLAALIGLVALAASRSTTDLRSSESTPRGLRLAWAVLVVWMFGSVLWAMDGSFALAKLADLAVIFVVATSVWAVARSDLSLVLRVPAWMTALLVGLGAAGLAELVLGEATGRLAALGGGPNVYGRNMALLAVALLVLGAIAERKATRLAMWLAASVAIVLLLASGSRGALVAFLVGVVAAAAMIGSSRHGRARLVYFTRLFLVAGILAASATVVIGTLPSESVEETVNRRFKDLTIESQYTSGRTDFLGRALACFSDYPIAGAGLAGFPAQGYGVYPHNLLAEVACEQGVIGLVSLALVTAAVGGFLWRSGCGKRCWPAASLMFVWLGASMFSGDIYDARGVPVLLALMVGTAGSSRDNAKSRDLGACVPQPIDTGDRPE